MDVQFQKFLTKRTMLIQITPIRTGHILRTMLEQSTVCHVSQEFGDHTSAALEAFAKLNDYLDNYREIARDKVRSFSTPAELDDYLKGHRNIAKEYSATERIRVDADLDALLARISQQQCVIGAGLKRIVVLDLQNRDLLRTKQVNIVLAPKAAFPAKIRISNLNKFKFDVMTSNSNRGSE